MAADRIAGEIAAAMSGKMRAESPNPRAALRMTDSESLLFRALQRATAWEEYPAEWEKVARRYSLTDEIFRTGLEKRRKLFSRTESGAIHLAGQTIEKAIEDAENGDAGAVRIPAYREHRFRPIVNGDSGGS